MRPPERTVAVGADRHDVAYADLAAGAGSASGGSTRPVEGECLVCFAARAVGAGAGCTGWSLLEAYRAARAPDAAGLAGRFARLGVGCACGLAATQPGGRAAYELAREHRERDVHTDELRVPHPLPACHGVRPGSAQPCALWVRGPRRRPKETFGCGRGDGPQAGLDASQARST